MYSRIYLEDDRGNFYHVKPATVDGKAIPYRVDRGKSKEIHTTVSNNLFNAMLGPGKYKLTAEHGKEFLPSVVEFEITKGPVQKTVRLRRWSSVADQGWYSGEVHIHRKLSEMPVVVRAEDLNVVFPLTYWVTDTEAAPSTHNKSGEAAPRPELIKVSDQHVIWPVNTEYEIFSVRGKQHTLGAFFVLGHSKPFELKTPPVGPIVQQAREQDALIDLDKHNWPWSMMLIPTMKMDLFELTNNHIWKTDFLFGDWYPEYAADYMKLEMDKEGRFTELGWIHFGFENYYTLLNCGFRISPSGGTASGVHPVPAGYGRVYVRTPKLRKEGFSFEEWKKGLKQGSSFVTTGPMMEFTIDGLDPGQEMQVDLNSPTPKQAVLKLRLPSRGKTRVEFVKNGKVIQPKTIKMSKENKVMKLTATSNLEFDQSAWVCARCFHQLPSGKWVFAHSAPFYFQKGEEPIQPRKAEVEYLIKRVSDEIKRHQNVLTKEQLKEFEAALDFYRGKREIAR